ncbi:MAG: hypothetical protein K5695_04175 [Oscillospiraceae bacterium]|nr:hypothetical protein [Oscillospiraceae bacterium]
MDGEMQDKIRSVLSDPESMQQLSELAQMLQGGDAPAPAMPDGMPDAAMLMKLGELLKQDADDKNAALLRAIRPHLSEERQRRTDQALRLLRLWAVFRTMQRTGMLQEFF